LFEGFEAFAETDAVLMGDGEHSYATLGAAGFANEVWTAAAIGVGYGRVYDLNEVKHCFQLTFAFDVTRAS
jgi:hypothetical protein